MSLLFWISTFANTILSPNLSDMSLRADVMTWQGAHQFEGFLVLQQLSNISQCGLVNSPNQFCDLVGPGLFALRRGEFVLFPDVVGGCDGRALGDYGQRCHQVYESDHLD